MKQRILESLDKESFFRREFGELPRPRGDEVQVICPFHADGDPSLSINLKTGLFHCHGCGVSGDLFKFYQLRHGCDFKEALAKLSEFAGVVNQKQPWGKIVAEYPYEDEKGRLLFQSVRLEPKSFRQRRPDGKGGWVWHLQGLKLVPYHLPALAAAARVYVVEGEKDADRLQALGLTASCNAQGAGKWRKGYNRYFQAKEVVVVPDNDDPGRAHAQAVAGHLHGVAASVRILELPGLPEKGDVSDWLAAGGTVEQLETLAAAAPEWTPPLAPPEPITGFSLSDLGNARRLVAQHGQDLRYCHLSAKWYYWTGKFWAEDNRGEVMGRAKLTVGGIYSEAGEGASPEKRKALAQHAIRSESNGRILAMVNLAKSEPGIPVDPGELDSNPWLLNCQNGMVNLTTGELRPHSRGDLITRITTAPYDPDAPCDLWEKVIYKILSENIDTYEFVQRALGYALSGSTREQCLFVLWGNGANGKSTALNMQKEIMGSYACQTPTETLLYKATPTLNNDIARLDGPRFVTAFESDSGRRLAESLVKQLTGGDSVAARFLYGEYFDFVPQFKLFLSTNSKPVIRGADGGIWRRIKMIPFTVKIPDEDQDQQLPDKLRVEAPGILAWLVRGCLSWQKQGLGVPAEVLAATAEYRAEMDVLGDFLAECCVVAPGATATAADLYSAYTTWADAQGMREREQLKQRSFGMCLSDRGFQRGRGTGGKGRWKGIGLKE